MKGKIFYVVMISLFSVGVMAQDCTFFFPQTQGTQLVRRGYDANGKLQNVMTYKVDEVENIPSGMEVEADYVYTDAAGTVISKGDIEASCQNGEFFMDMKDILSYPAAVSMINQDVEISGDFMNYPDASSDGFGDGSGSYFDDTSFKIYNKKNKKDRINVSVYDREYLTTENVTTPAGTFECTKIKYNVDIDSPKNKKSGYGYEWYAPNIGIVRSEQYDKNKVLQSYTVLEEIK